MKNKIAHIIIGIAAVLSTSCNKLDLQPSDRFPENAFWTSQSKAQLMLNTIYAGIFHPDYFFTNEALSDNAYIGRGDRDNAKLISSGQHNPATKRMSDEWTQHYSGIRNCHIFLENIHRVPDLNEAVKNRMCAEARFFRAFHYFQLTTWFGNVPFFDYLISLEESKTIGRTEQTQILDFIHNELEQIQDFLPINSLLPNGERGRVTKGAAIALNARVFLYSNQWNKVVAECKKLMFSEKHGHYELFPNYEALFLPENEYNAEVIFDLQFVPEQRMWGNMFDLIPLTAGARLNFMGATQELVDDYIMLNGMGIGEVDSGYDEENPYANRDPRLKATLVHHLYQWKNEEGKFHTIYIKPNSDPTGEGRDEYEPGSNKTSTGYYLRKYFDPTHNSDLFSGLNLILIRYADVLLMYAEAKNELRGVDAEVWQKTIGSLRERAGFVEPEALKFNPNLNQEEWRKIIRRERRTELAMEGLRIFDIRRWKTAEQVLNIHPHGARFGEPTVDNGYIRLEKRFFNPMKDYSWPVPLNERDQNPNLDQNPGW